MTPQTPEGLQKAWALLSMHNSELLLENEELKQRLMKKSLWYAITRSILIWINKENNT